MTFYPTSLRKEIKDAERKEKEKTEKKFKEGHMKGVLDGLKHLTGMNKPRASKGNKSVEENEDFANRLNTFYCRFERDDLTSERESILERVKYK